MRERDGEERPMIASFIELLLDKVSLIASSCYHYYIDWDGDEKGNDTRKKGMKRREKIDGSYPRHP